MEKRVILHVDMNNFYASVESLYNPEFKDVPMAVAGNPEKRHGIILAKNQLAKAKGVSTGEPIWQAMQKCKGLVLCEPHYERYHYYSKKAFEIYSNYTSQVEPYGLDECWLDVTGSNLLFGDGVTIAKKIMADIKNQLGLTVSVGVSFNKVFAKLGSDLKKPDAYTEISCENFKNKIWDLPANQLLYVGKSTDNTLQKYGIYTIGELANTSVDFLKIILGKMGVQLWEYANGLDKTVVAEAEFHRKMKSISNSTTTPQDLQTDEEVKVVLYSLAEKVAHRLRKHAVFANGLSISIRRSNLEHYQKSVSLEHSVASSDAIFEQAYKLFKASKEGDPIRSLGISAEKLTEDCIYQISFFDEKTDDKALKLDETKDLLRSKYGVDSVKRALLLNKEPKK